MTKTQQIHNLAVAAGLPETITVHYHRQARRWYITYPTAMGTDAALGHPTTIIASYASVAEAEAALPKAATQFHVHYERVLALLAGTVTALTQAEARLLLDADPHRGMAAPTRFSALVREGLVTAAPQLGSDWLAYRRTTLGETVVAQQGAALLTVAGRSPTPIHNNGHDSIAQRDTTAIQADALDPPGSEAWQQVLDTATAAGTLSQTVLAAAQAYVARLEAAKSEATGRYTSRHPEAPKAPIYWEQPIQRQAPFYTHEVVCTVCGQTVQVQNHSPRPPTVCEDEACRAKHSRVLARERKRRQRARQRASRDNSTT